ncbi:hypothetical protein D018_3042 [Vibrio parahaemolyticus VP2007-007]|nr:hypothetical protein D018_3042 [Vibrio parahaemolyticus VP2007-007]
MYVGKSGERRSFVASVYAIQSYQLLKRLIALKFRRLNKV